MAHELAIDPAESPLAVPRPVPGTAPSRRQALPVAGESAVADPEAVQAAAGNFLPALGMGPGREEPQETPARMARAYAEFPGVQSSRLTAFPNQKGHDDLVLAREIPFQTVCAHHLLPLAGVAQVGYLPVGPILGLSTLARLVEHIAARAQTRERLTAHVADALVTRLSLRGAGVVLEAGHSCIPVRRACSRREGRHLRPARDAA